MDDDENIENVAEYLRIVGKRASFTYIGGPLDGEKIPPGARATGDVVISCVGGCYIVDRRNHRVGAYWTPDR